MSFIAKNPISAVEITSLPPVPIKGTRGIFAKKDGWYEIDDEGNVKKYGIIFYPSVDEDGNLSWTNDGELENPETVNIKGDKGDDYVLTDADKEEIAGKISEVSVPKSEKNNVVYARYDNKDTTIPFSSGSADPYSMVRRDSRGRIISADPELDNECATKGYVDGLIGDVDVKRTVWVDFDGSCTIEETGWTGTFGELLIKADYGEYATYRSPFALNDLYDFYFVKKLEDVILYFTPLSTKIEQEYRIDYDATATVTLYNDDVKIIYTSDVEENAYTNNYEYRTWSVSVDKNPQNLASTTEFGCVKIGGYIAVTDGVISVDKTALLGDIETALDNIIALQEAYIGGENA